MTTLFLDGCTLTIENFMEAVCGERQIAIDPRALDGVNASRRTVEDIVESQKVVYGINTGFGSLANTTIPGHSIESLQHNLIMSHAVAVGEPYPDDLVRGAMILRVNALAKGYSGVRPLVLQLLVDMVNRGVIPVVPRQGSLGASGDLAPLAHMALVMIGMGEANWHGERLPGAVALERVGLSPISLSAKEGLGLINGTPFITAAGAMSTWKAQKLVVMADLIGAATLEALMGTFKAFDPKVGMVRPHPGQISSAARLTAFSQGSTIATSHTGCGRVQDAYTLRCMPQVHGAVEDAVDYCRGVMEREMNSATDNPLVFSEQGEVISAGNFHGEPVSLALDFLAIAVSELASIGERRMERLLNPALSEGLPAFCVKGSGLNSGFMIVQYTAAHLVSENKILGHPATLDSIPTSANKEDHVSMGGVAANKLLRIVENVERVLSFEALCACQALDFRKPMEPGHAVRELCSRIRSEISHLDDDRVMIDDLNRIHDLLSSGALYPEKYIQGGDR
ncbi:MAG: histidine ammonia-lyase [Candidatus Wallbacteria bacterium HGW-Wallbacteria-1]|uniref:Histidine ammonia-lyase n=1 Tax=Candidatus Wallbacteria bacterium HGW-Wallbacteria-1 TaxID=2013854 RepID=A0A2N1PTD6_9BACT|nr:MAG: histidine ammonia-lyase [Candidatus Wallbacteria bacterium HGW-Wallbacteria-1]